MELPDPIAEIITSLPVNELKKRIITANGLTLAQEEEILALDPSDTTEAMAPEDAVAFLQTLRNED